MEKLIDDLSGRTSVAEDVVKLLRRSFSEIESRQRNLDLARESVVERMMEIEVLRESYEKKLRDLEGKEKEFYVFKEGKKRRLALEEDELSVKRVELLNDVRMKEAKLNKQLASLKEVKAREESLSSARESLARREREVDMIIGTLDERIHAMDERENAFKSIVERKMREMLLKEEQLSLKWQEFVKEVRLADEKFREQERMRNGFSERLELAENKLQGMRAKIDESFKEIESLENVISESVAKSVKGADLIGELVENQLKDFEKMKEEFHSYREDKMQELVLKEQELNAMSEELIKDAKLRNKQLTERADSVNQHLKRLELAQDKVENLKKIVHEKFKQIRADEVELESIRDWVESKMDEADSKGKELERKEKKILMREDTLISRENELEQRREKLESWQKELEVKQREIDLAQEVNERRLEELDRKEKSVNSLKDFTNKCFKEHIALKKELRLQKDLVKKRFRDLDLNESVDLKFVLRMDGKTLQMFLNDPEKDVESMGDEIFKVLHLSSDPAKLVLDAMVGFYPPHLRKGDVEINVRRTCIILLEQLIRMTKRIQPCTREEALELASSWKSKMRAGGKNPLEVLGFLHLLAAYNLASYFGKDEVSSFLMMVAQHRQKPILGRALGLTESFTEFATRNAILTS